MTATARIRMLIVGVIAPLVIAVAGLVAVVAALGDLPDPIAVHWGPSGAPDGFGSPWMLLVLLVVVVGAYSVFAWRVTVSSGQHGGIAANQKIILAIGPFLATLVAIIVAGSVLMQRGLADAKDAGSITVVLIVALAAGAAAGIIAWFVLPAAEPATRVELDDGPEIDLAPTERAVWLRRISPQRWLAVLLLVVGVVLIVGGGLVVWAAAPFAVFLIWMFVMLLVAALVASTLFWRVRVSDAGFLVVSAVGIPRYSIPLADIEWAGAIEVDPMRDFGGWGIRWGGAGRLGIVTRRGDAIEVRRTNGKSLVVTVDGARQGAALLSALVARNAPTTR